MDSRCSRMLWACLRQTLRFTNTVDWWKIRTVLPLRQSPLRPKLKPKMKIRSIPRSSSRIRVIPCDSCDFVWPQIMTNWYKCLTWLAVPSSVKRRPSHQPSEQQPFLARVISRCPLNCSRISRGRIFSVPPKINRRGSNPKIAPHTSSRGRDFNCFQRSRPRNKARPKSHAPR